MTVPAPTPSPPPDPADGRAIEFDYRWQEASVPPPDHYHYRIAGTADGCGRVEFTPGYGFEAPPTWIETFTLDAAGRAALFDLVHQRQVLQHRWQCSPATPVGGSQHSLRMRCGAQQVDLPAPLCGDSADLAQALARAIVATVPAPVWQALRERHAAYLSARR